MAEAPAPKIDSPATINPPASSPAAVTAHFPNPPAEMEIGVRPADRGDDAVYRPLSSFAIAAFSIAAVYTVIVVIGAIISALKGMPWLMGGLFALLPISAVILGGIAWLEIRASEGTRTGRSLAGWAITVSLVVSLGYWAYYAAIYYVIRGQADTFCREYFDNIKDGKMELAFLNVVPPKGRPRRDDPALRDTIENRFNPEPGGGKPGGGLFNMFKDHVLTHVLRQEGPDAAVQSLGVVHWEYKDYSYIVRSRYRITSPELTYEGIVTCKSTEPQGKDKGRQWQLVLQETQPASAPDMVKVIAPTDEGFRLLNLQRNAALHLGQWQNRLRSMNVLDNVESYLGTLEPAQRSAVADNFNKALPDVATATLAPMVGNPWAGFAAACTARFGLEDEKRLPGYAAFQRGEFVTLDKANFWPDREEDRKAALQAIRQMFHTTPDLPMGVMHVDPEKLAYWSRKGNRIEIRKTVQFRVRTLLPSLEGDVIMECDASALDPNQTSAKADIWRIVGIEVTSMRALPPNTPPMAGDRPIGHPGMMGGAPGPEQ